MKLDRHAGLLLLILAVLTGWRLLAAWHTGMELYADEAQYWVWSLSPDWGYYSKPPVVAWAIWLGTALFGDGELGVRAVTVFVYPLIAWLIFLLARRCFEPAAEAGRIAFWAALIFATLPMVTLGAWLITTDAFLLLFWTLSLYALVVALDGGRWRAWLLLGLFVGLGLLSKYSMVFFGLSLVIYLALTPDRRRLLVDPKPYAAALVALLVMAPNIYWNAAHQFVTFQHTAEISQLDRALFHPDELLEFFLGQFIVFGPLAFAALLMIAVRPRIWIGDDRLRLLAVFTIAPLVAFLALSLLSRAFANWAAFAYVAASLLVAAWLVSLDKRVWLIASLVLHLILAAGIYHLHAITDALDIQLTRKTDPYGRVTGYRELGTEVAERLRAVPNATLLGDDRKIFAWLLYYARPESEGGRMLNLHGVIDDHFALTVDIRQAPKGTFLLITRSASLENLTSKFEVVTPQPPIRLHLYPDYEPEFQVWLLQNYRAP